MRKFANVFCFVVPPPPAVAVVFCAFLEPPQAAARSTTPVASTATLANVVHRSLRVTSSTSRFRRRPAGLRVLRYPLDSYKDVRMRARLDAHELAPTCTKLLRLSFLEHAVGAVALRRVENASVAEPEGDVRRAVVPVGDEVARAQLVLGDRGTGLLLLVGVARDEPAEASVGHVDEARAVDTVLRHPAPEVRRAEVGARLLNRIAGLFPQPVRVGVAAERVGPQPARVVVRGADPRPTVPLLLDNKRLPGERLRHLARILPRVGPDGRQRAGVDRRAHAGRILGSSQV